MKTRINKKIAAAVLAGLLTVSFLPMTASACRGKGGQGQDGGCVMKGGQKWKQSKGSLGIWKNAQTVQDLGLNADQVSKLKNADFVDREKQQALRAEMDSLHLKIEQAFSADKVDADAVRKVSKKMATVKGQMIEQRTEAHLTLHKLLTPEQIAKLKTLRQGRKGQGKNGMNKPCRMNGQGGGDGMQKGQGKM
ncbi:LTXXQ motif family protein [Candidatus Electrothrix laxa]